jgi:hypothetical protein
LDGEFASPFVIPAKRSSLCRPGQAKREPVFAFPKMTAVAVALAFRGPKGGVSLEFLDHFAFMKLVCVACMAWTRILWESALPRG